MFISSSNYIISFSNRGDSWRLESAGSGVPAALSLLLLLLLLHLNLPAGVVSGKQTDEHTPATPSTTQHHKHHPTALKSSVYYVFRLIWRIISFSSTCWCTPLVRHKDKLLPPPSLLVVTGVCSDRLEEGGSGWSLPGMCWTWSERTLVNFCAAEGERTKRERERERGREGEGKGNENRWWGKQSKKICEKFI